MMRCTCYYKNTIITILTHNAKLHIFTASTKDFPKLLSSLVAFKILLYGKVYFYYVP